MKKIAFINHRYGLEVTGGSELHCRILAERFKNIYDVTVVTTCAIDDSTWANFYPEGEQTINGIKVIRFPVEHERVWDSFADAERLAKNDNHMFEDEIQWIMDQGPYSPLLFEYLHMHYHEYDAVIFMTYLYYTSAICILGIPNALFLPTAHDETPLYFRHFEKVFNQPQGFIFNTEEEQRLIYKRFPQTKDKKYIVGCFGIDMPDEGSFPNVRGKYNLKNNYIIYAGRITPAKGCDTLISFFEKYKSEISDETELVLIGKNDMEIPKRDYIRFLGFVPDEDKLALMKEARLFCIASHYESLSIVALEALVCRTPILVTEKCEVLKGHVKKSNAGYIFNTYEEFRNAITDSKDDTSAYFMMGDNGFRYICNNYSWERITENITSIIETVQFTKENANECVKLDTFFNAKPDPAYAQRNIPVIFASDNNYVLILAVALQSLIDNSKTSCNYDICVLSDGINAKNKEILRNTVGNRINISLRFIEVAKELDKQSFKIHNEQLSRATFMRLLLPDLFLEYNKVLYLDCDIIINRDISELFDVDINGCYLAAIPDAHIKEVYKFRNSMDAYLDTLGLANKGEYFNAGVVLFNLEELRKEYSSEDLMNIATSKKWKWEDQDVLNYIAKGRVRLLDLKWDVLWSDCPRCQQIMMTDSNYMEALANPYIIHYAAGMLPTKVENNRFSNEFWKVARKAPCYESILKVTLDNYSGGHNVQDTNNQNVLTRKIRSLIWRIRNQGIKETSVYARNYFRRMQLGKSKRAAI